jgi:hypothetical protein
MYGVAVAGHFYGVQKRTQRTNGQMDHQQHPRLLRNGADMIVEIKYDYAANEGIFTLDDGTVHRIKIAYQIVFLMQLGMVRHD